MTDEGEILLSDTGKSGMSGAIGLFPHAPYQQQKVKYVVALNRP